MFNEGDCLLTPLRRTEGDAQAASGDLVARLQFGWRGYSHSVQQGPVLAAQVQEEPELPLLLKREMLAREIEVIRKPEISRARTPNRQAHALDSDGLDDSIRGLNYEFRGL
jgi:uncharacterized protein (DUF58 family)